MERLVRSRRLAYALGLLAASLLLCGCPAAERKTETSPSPQTQPSQRSEKVTESEQAKSEQTKAEQKASLTEPAANVTPKAESEVAAPGSPSSKPAKEAEPAPPEEETIQPVDLGTPLVDHAEKLVKLDPKRPTWLDPENKRVVLLGQVSRPDYLLEFFATLGDRGYESVVVLDVEAHVVHAALLALGAKTGHPVQFTPEFIPASGTEVDVDVAWKDKDGKRQQAKAQQWIRNVQSKEALDTNWVFAGSGFYKDDATGQEYYQADGGDLISVLNLPTAMLDLPIRSVSGLESRQFEIFAEHVPPRGTPVTIILTPKLDTTPKPAAAKQPDTTPKPETPAKDDAEAGQKSAAGPMP
jgi:hypothetical protein